MFNLFPREPAFFEMFTEAAQNMVLGSRRLKEMLESYTDVDKKAREIKRIEFYQTASNGRFKCRENAIAITKLEEALLWLNKRTQDR